MKKPIMYIDMDGVLVDFESALTKVSPEMLEKFAGEYDNIPGIFALMDPVPGALEAVDRLKEKYDLYILSSSPWENPTALGDKLAWVKKYFGGDGQENIFFRKVIFSSVKHLNRGDILIDDRTANGAGDFLGRHIHFGSSEFPNWQSVLNSLL
jgi:putative 5''''(3'''')-deoxyribonucleotidase